MRKSFFNLIPYLLLSLFLSFLCVTSFSEIAEAQRNQSQRRQAPRRQAEVKDVGTESYTPRLTYDLGGAAGQSGGKSYTEINLGLNFWALSWLNWRNSVFYRFTETSVYGLDTSLRPTLALGSSALGLTLFGGPGYRFANENRSTLFGEAGMFISLANLTLGAGARRFLYSATNSSLSDETQFFLILGGSGSL
ncbi:MAG: hypothetical protein COT74_13795 [Bdellovibrionales bacterium CG10_big_fil_rev_8_21_14_0_10_45_34]|nr:MAG: hypothetical protein COT74_13795 [Bdellovibrionales bacterium CG10_big_fil_rev_8_21_14_0_10_45_34]